MRNIFKRNKKDPKVVEMDVVAVEGTLSSSIHKEDNIMKTAYLLLNILTKQAMLALLVGIIALAAASAIALLGGALTWTGGVFISAATLSLIANITAAAGVSSFLVGVGSNFFALYKMKKLGVYGAYSDASWDEMLGVIAAAKGFFKAAPVAPVAQ